MEKLEKIIRKRQQDLSKRKRKFNPVHFLTDTFYLLKGWESLPKEQYQKSKRLHYGRHARAAKLLLGYCNHDLSLAMQELYRMASEAKDDNMDWVISTIFKRWKKKIQIH